MKTSVINRGEINIALVQSDEIVISDVQNTLDFMVSVQYETACDRIVINKEAVAPDFFVLSSRLAGEILQKFANYRIKLAIVGDYSGYTSKPLKDFIYESNRGRDFFFVETVDEAIDRLS